MLSSDVQTERHRVMEPDAAPATSLLRMAVYASPLRAIAKPTGVGQHIAQMACQLAEAQGVSPLLLASRSDYAQIRPDLPAALRDVSVKFLPEAERLTRALLLGTNFLNIERWSGEVDWVYCPKEQPVATRKARLAVTVHDMLALEPPIPGLPGISRTTRLRWRWIMRAILQRADLIATVSEFTKGRILALCDVAEDRIVVVGDGVADSYFREAQSNDEEVLAAYGLEAQQYVMTVGSLTYRKGGDQLLELADRFLRKQIPLKIVITGRRHDATLLDQLNEMRRGAPNLPITLPGYVPQEKQAVLLSQSLAHLFPSRYEGFGIPALEAMAAGTPTVCSRAGALPEITGAAGLYVDIGSIDELLAVIKELADSPHLRQQYVEAGRKHVQGHTWKQCASRLLEGIAER